jgi:Trk K+ transport system NAD-binding subunit
VRPAIRVILRVFNDELDSNLERSFGPNSAFSASALAAPTFAAAAVSRAIDVVLPVGDTLLGVALLTIEPSSRLAGLVRAVEEAHAIRVIHHEVGAGRRQRTPTCRLADGDTIAVLGTLPALEALRLKIARGQPGLLGSQAPQTYQLDTVIVCGLGKVGYRVVRRLCGMRPRPRVVVVRTAGTSGEFMRHIDQLGDVRTVIGDARDLDVLRQAGIDSAYALAALTSDDGLNLQIGLAARRLCPDIHLVLRVFSDPLAEKLGDMFGIRTAYSTSGLAAPTLAAAAVLGDVSQAFNIGRQLFSTDRIVVRKGDMLAGQSIETLRSRHGALVINVRRGADTSPMPPPPDMMLAPGDEIMLLAPLEALARLRAARGI